MKSIRWSRNLCILALVAMLLPFAAIGSAAAAAVPVPFHDDVENGTNGWTASGFWHRVLNPDQIRVEQEIRTSLVQLPDAGYLPKSYSGNSSWWFGEDATGTFIGADFGKLQEPYSGGNSKTSHSGNLVSPPIDLTNVDTATLSFFTWWEIEGVDVDRFDMMYVDVSTDGGKTFSQLGKLNPIDDANTASHIPYSTNGVNQSGSWGQVYLDLTPYARHQIQIRFRFQTEDSLYNGFRGWFIDNVSVSEEPPPPLTLTSVQPPVAKAAQLVTVWGTGFAEDATVTIGSIEAEATVLFHDKILAYVPGILLPGTYDVTVANPGKTATLLGALTVSTAASPSIFSLSPSMIGCSSETDGKLAITGDEFVAGATVKLGQLPLSGVAYGGSKQLQATLPIMLAEGNYNLTVTNPNGLSSTKFAALGFSASGSISGKVTAADSGLPLGLAHIFVSGPASGTIDADENGAFTVTGLPNGTYALSAGKDGYVTSSASVTIAGCGSGTADISLPLSAILVGRVTSESTGAAIAGASVILNTGASATTDSDGYYRLMDIPAGQYTVRAARQYYTPSDTVPVQLVAATEVVQNFALSSTVITGHVTSAATGAPVAGALVALSNGDTATTDAAGEYVLAGLLTGTYSLAVSKSGFLTASVENTKIVAGQTVSVDVDLYGNALSGRVTALVGGDPVAGAVVTLNTGASRLTDADGFYFFGNLDNRIYAVTVTAPGFISKKMEGAGVSSAATTTVNVALNRTSITGRVTAVADGAGIAGARVVLSGGASCTTSSDGYYALTDTPAGAVNVTVERTGFVTRTFANVTVVAGTPLVLNAALSTRALAGRITSAVTGEPVAGATVTASTGATAGTDANGNYLFSDLVPGTVYSLTAKGPGYLPKTASGVRITAGVTATADFALDTTIITGAITSASGAPVAGATVTLGNGAVKTSDASGKYLFTNVAPGTYTVSVTNQEFTATASNTVAVAAGEVATLNLQLPAGAAVPSLRGTVTNTGTGKPIPGAAVTAGNRTSTTDAAGKYSIAGLPPRSYTLTVSAAGFVPKSVAGVVVAAGTVKTVDVALGTTVLKGKVTAARSAIPVSGALVSIPQVGVATTDKGGVFEFAGIAAGTYTVSVSAGGFLPAVAGNVTVAPAKESVVSVALVARALAGRVTIAATGAPAAGAKVTAGGKSCKTDAGGNYLFQDILPGPHDVSVSLPGFVTAVVPRVAALDGKTAVADVALNATLLSGRVTSAMTGTPVSGATVAITGGAQTVTDAAGDFSFVGIVPGKYTLTASRAGFDTVTLKEFAVKTGAAKTVTVRLVPSPVE